MNWKKFQRFLDDFDGEKEDLSDLAVDNKKVTKPGDLWILGDHRIYCGDSSVVESYKALLD